MKTHPSDFASWRGAFTLIELLVVVSIMVLVASFVAPAFNQMGQTATLTTAGEDFVDALNLARQTAITRNLRVEVRIMELPSSINSGDLACRAYQLFIKKYDGTLQPLTKVVRFPEPVILSTSTNVNLQQTQGQGPSWSSTSSSILVPYSYDVTAHVFNYTTDTSNTAAMWPVPGGPSNYQYVSFDYLPTGETSLSAINGGGTTATWMAKESVSGTQSTFSSTKSVSPMLTLGITGRQTSSTAAIALRIPTTGRYSSTRS